MNKNIILIMGLPGSGKTFLAKKLFGELSNCNWHNADDVRTLFNDWDFSVEGRLRQATRMRYLADKSKTEFDIIDMVCPIPEMVNIINPDFIIWMNTIESGRFEDTNKMFVPPKNYDMVIDSFDYDFLKIKTTIMDIICGNTKEKK